MALVIYMLHKCKVCMQREEIHEEISSILRTMGIDTLGIHFGQMDNGNYYPLSRHDSLCRKQGDNSVYVAPNYIYEDGNNIVKLPDISAYPSAQAYAQYVLSVAQQLQQQ